MPRQPMSGRNLCTLLEDLSLGALLRVMPTALVQEALAATDRQSQRYRLLPAATVVYLVLMLAVRADVSIKENLRGLLEGLRRQFGWRRVRVPKGTAVSAARQRLGAAPLAWLFARMAHPLARRDQPGAFWRHWRVMAIDGTTVEVQHTAANCATFGLPRNQYGAAGYPQVKLVALLECGTRAIIAWVHGPSRSDEATLGDELLAHLAPDMLLLADRGYYSFARWREAAARAGALVWRVKATLKLKRLKELDDGSFLARVRPSAKLCRKGLAQPDETAVVRVIEYVPVLADGTRGETVRLLTTILDPALASALDLARLFPQRWSIEVGFDEVKTHLRGRERVLRSQRPDLVVQELHGFFLAYFAIRATMAEAAARGGVAPTRLSFTHAVNVLRRQAVPFPPGAEVGPSVCEHSPGNP